jgi:hypothetical protein
MAEGKKRIFKRNSLFGMALVLVGILGPQLFSIQDDLVNKGGIALSIVGLYFIFRGFKE